MHPPFLCFTVYVAKNVDGAHYSIVREIELSMELSIRGMEEEARDRRSDERTNGQTGLSVDRSCPSSTTIL